MAGLVLRALILPRYREVRSLLEHLDSGDAAARRELASRLASAIQDPGFSDRNAPMKGTLESWRVTIADLAQEGAPVAAETVAEAAIALLAMPSFQFSYVEEGNRSPTLVLLGDADGGFCGAFYSRDTRVSEVFSSGRGEPYAVMGEGMIVLTRDEVSILHEVATRTKATEYAEVARNRLLVLLEWSLAAPDRAVAVSFEL